MSAALHSTDQYVDVAASGSDDRGGSLAHSSPAVAWTEAGQAGEAGKASATHPREAVVGYSVSDA
ncbi:MAG: hypothetical protein GXP62_01490 [Oligoflexia bacterium]|nr:hypothetical protein [Oligoflexia bacterium]